MMKGVQVVAAAHDGTTRAYCSHWVCQVSFEEPILLASVSPKHDTHPLIEASGRFAVSILAGDQIDAETALRSGIVNQIFPQAELMNEARGLAARIIECGPIVVRETKEFMYRSLGQPMNEALHMEGLYYERIRKSHDYDEGTQAFAEKRNPEFERR